MTRLCKTTIAFVACLSITLLISGTAVGAIVRLKPTATVSSSVVILADVADVFDRDPQVVEALQRATLMPAPAAGSEVELEFSTIRQRLKSLGFNLARLEMTGNSSVMVRNRAGRLNRRGTKSQSARQTEAPVTSWQLQRAKQLLSKAVRNYLQPAGLGEFDVELKLDPELAKDVIAGQRTGYEIRGGQPPWDAWQAITIRLLDRENVVQTIQTQCRIVMKPLVPVAQYALPAGHVIDRTDVTFKPVDTTSGPVPTIDELVGRETTRALRPGQPIDKTAIRQIPLIRRGDVVTAVARVGGIRVKRQLYARSDGGIGERVTLSTLDRREQIEATVSGYHEAVVLDSKQTSTRQTSADLVRGQSQRPRFIERDSGGGRIPSPEQRQPSYPYRSTNETSRRAGGAR